MSICIVNWPIPSTHSFVQASIQTRDLLTLYSGLSGSYRYGTLPREPSLKGMIFSLALLRVDPSPHGLDGIAIMRLEKISSFRLGNL